MTGDEFDTAYRWFCYRRPFRSFMVEFTSGQNLLVGHPEAIHNEAQLYVMRRPDGGSIVFAADSVARLLDGPMQTGH